MSLTVRPFEDRDLDGYYYVRDMTYNDGQPTAPEKRGNFTTHPFVAEQDGRIMGAFNIVDLTCTIGDRGTLKCGGIAGVAVAPEFRHLGVGSAMMRWSIPYMKSQGYQIASLYAFRESFYRKFGYELCGHRIELTVPAHRLPRIKPELPVRKIAWDDPSALQACHKAFCRRYSGMNFREAWHWKRVLDEKKSIYVVGDPIEAYAILEHSWEFWVPQWVNEVVWSTARGYRSIIAVLSQICINKTSLGWYEPSDSPYLQTFRDAQVDAKVVRPVMYRLLDVPGCFEAVAGTPAGALSLSLEDELIPENSGNWRVESDGKETTCDRVESADLQGDVQAWTLALLGDPGVDRGFIEEKEAGALARASQVLPKERAYCLEFF
jgi:predicted acetyltransferase